MDDKSTLFAALVCALAIVVVLIAEHRPSFFWWRYLFGLEKTSPDEMEWNEVLQRIRKRTQRAFEREPGSKVLSNGTDAYQWMMEQIGAESCYEIAKRAYICEQGSHRGQTERAKVEHEYIQWIARKFI